VAIVANRTLQRDSDEMKVFRIRADRNRHQMIGGAPGFVERHPPTHASAPLLNDWQRLGLTVQDPLKKRGEFLFFPLEFLVTSLAATASLTCCMQNDVQVLPVELEDAQEDYCLWNIVNFVEALDLHKTTFCPPPLRSIPRQWTFDPDRLTRPMLFREPRCPGIPLLVTGIGDPAKDFYSTYKTKRMQGLKFELLWKQA
jgi:hypothetical protein